MPLAPLDKLNGTDAYLLRLLRNHSVSNPFCKTLVRCGLVESEDDREQLLDLTARAIAIIAFPQALSIISHRADLIKKITAIESIESSREHILIETFEAFVYAYGDTTSRLDESDFYSIVRHMSTLIERIYDRTTNTIDVAPRIRALDDQLWKWYARFYHETFLRHRSDTSLTCRANPTIVAKEYHATLKSLPNGKKQLDARHECIDAAFKAYVTQQRHLSTTTIATNLPSVIVSPPELTTTTITRKRSHGKGGDGSSDDDGDNGDDEKKMEKKHAKNAARAARNRSQSLLQRAPEANTMSKPRKRRIRKIQPISESSPSPQPQPLPPSSSST